MKHPFKSIRQICLISLIWLLSPSAVFAANSTLELKTATITASSPDNFAPDSTPTLTLDTRISLSQRFNRLVARLQNKNPTPVATLSNPQGKPIQTLELKSGQTQLSLANTDLSPGQYSLLVNNQPSLTFTWGVLALNTDQDLYAVGDVAYLQMASLSETGHTLCDSNLELKVNDQVIPIENSQTCGPNNVTDSPDYFAHFTPTSAGTYHLRLTNLSNSYTVTKIIKVVDQPEFIVERVGATRINPFKSDYTMTLTITSQSNWSGIIKEQLPVDFEALTPTFWEVDLTAGISNTLSYTYRAPKHSPDLFELGPLKVGDYQEQRSWSLASDATFQMQTGYYVGDGADDRAITGVGFQPELVILQEQGNTGNDGVLFKTSSLTGEATSKLYDGEADESSNNIQSLDSDGFTVGSDADVNSANIRYVWTAFRGSDCTSSGTFCVGSYSGDGTTPRSLTLTGFQPNLVVVKRSGASSAVFRTSDMGTNASNSFGFVNETSVGTEAIRSLDATGFTIGNNAQVNTSSNTYWFFAFKSTSNAFATGTFTGDGTSGRSISTSFNPESIWIKNSNATSATPVYFHQPENNDNHSNPASNSYPQTNKVTSLDTNAFTVGSDVAVNENTKTIYWVAFAGIPALSPSGTYSFATGTYSGNGTSQSITGLGFRPDLVIIKDESAANYAVFRTKMIKGDSTAYFSAATANFAGGITSLDSDGFSVGSSATVNTGSTTYHYQAFGNAFDPEDNSGAADFAVGTLIGNLADDRDILRLPFQPDLVTIKGVGGTSGVWRTSNHSGDLTSFFGANADTSDHIQSLNSDGFQVGGSSRVNNNNVLDQWFAFKSSTTMKVSSYTGTGSTQNITSVGFQPQLVWIKNSASAVNGVFRPDTLAGDVTVYYANSAAVSDRITGLLSNGFSIGGNRTETNTLSTTYQYAAWRANSNPTAPATPYAEGASNPTGITDLTPEFSAIHSDSDSDPALHYEIEVNTASNFSGTVMWDTGQTSMSSLASGSRSSDISYAGTSLSYNGTTYYWRIRFWDNKGATGAWSATQNFSTNSAPSSPSLDSPTDTASNQSLTPSLLTTTTDTNSDYLRYKIELCENVGMSTNCQTFDQTVSQTGWSGQNTQSNTAYTSGTQANYTVQSALTASFTYYWRSYAIDPGGTNTWSSTQGTPYSFDTLTLVGSDTFYINGVNFSGINIH